MWMISLGRITLFTIVGTFLIVILKVEFSTGSIIMRDPSIDTRIYVFLICHIILCVIATLRLSLIERLILFFNLTVFSGINVAIWPIIYDMVEYARIPITESIPFFLKALEIYKMSSGFAPRDIALLIIPFLYCIAIMFITLGAKKGYIKMRMYFDRLK
ncbi:hypothetical protein SRRS_11970 [Sporomusa rhizae]